MSTNYKELAYSYIKNGESLGTSIMTVYDKLDRKTLYIICDCLEATVANYDYITNCYTGDCEEFIEYKAPISYSTRLIAFGILEDEVINDIHPALHELIDECYGRFITDVCKATGRTYLTSVEDLPRSILQKVDSSLGLHYTDWLREAAKDYGLEFAGCEVDVDGLVIDDSILRAHLGGDGYAAYKLQKVLNKHIDQMYNCMDAGIDYYPTITVTIGNDTVEFDWGPDIVNELTYTCDTLLEHSIIEDRH